MRPESDCRGAQDPRGIPHTSLQEDSATPLSTAGQSQAPCPLRPDANNGIAAQQQETTSDPKPNLGGFASGTQPIPALNDRLESTTPGVFPATCSASGSHNAPNSQPAAVAPSGTAPAATLPAAPQPSPDKPQRPTPRLDVGSDLRASVGPGSDRSAPAAPEAPARGVSDGDMAAGILSSSPPSLGQIPTSCGMSIPRMAWLYMYLTWHEYTSHGMREYCNRQ